MPIKMIRIDDRLIHGQVAAVWSKQSNIEQIIIVNDAVANDKLQQSVQKMAAPSNIKVSIFSIDEFIDIIHKKIEIHRETMILCTTPQDVLKLMDAKRIANQVIVGGMRSGGDRKMINKSVFVNEEEDQAFHELMKLGVEVIIWAVPSDVAIKYDL